MSISTGYQFLPTEEQEKVTAGIRIRDDTGLHGQFPHYTLVHETRVKILKDLFIEAEQNILTILQADVFEGFRNYYQEPKVYQLVAEDLSDIIRGQMIKSPFMSIWSVSGPRDHLILAIHEGKLKLCTREYIHPSGTSRGNIQWYRLFKESEKLEHDSVRLHKVLEILSIPETAWTYLRARIFEQQELLNNRT